MSTTAADSIAGVAIPDTELVREITAFIRDTEDDLLFDHSRRGFCSACCRAGAADCSRI